MITNRLEDVRRQIVEQPHDQAQKSKRGNKTHLLQSINKSLDIWRICWEIVTFIYLTTPLAQKELGIWYQI